MTTLKDFVGKPKAELKKINKEDLISLLQNNSIQLEDPSSTTADLKNIQDSLNEIKTNVLNVILADHKKLKRKVRMLEDENMDLHNDLENLNFDMAKLDRYGRRNNIEIGGIPEVITNLEETTIAILKMINIDCTSRDIEGCHRLRLTNAEKKVKYPQKNNCPFY